MLSRCQMGLMCTLASINVCTILERSILRLPREYFFGHSRRPAPIEGPTGITTNVLSGLMVLVPPQIGGRLACCRCPLPRRLCEVENGRLAKAATICARSSEPLTRRRRGRALIYVVERSSLTRISVHIRSTMPSHDPCSSNGWARSSRAWRS
jgi:hypothetical protein